MPTLQTTQNVTGLTALTAGVAFTGLVVLEPGPGMDRVGCCEFANECLILQITDGQLAAASLYRGGTPTSTGLTTLTLPFILPPTTGDQYYRLGYQAGNIADLLANLPVHRCSDCYTYELRIPDVATLEINDFQDTATIAGSISASINALQAEINNLTSDLTNAQTQNTSLQAQLTASQSNLFMAQTDLTAAIQNLATAQANLSTANAFISDLNAQIAALQDQVDTLTADSQDAAALNEQIANLQAQIQVETTAAAKAAQAVTSAIATLNLRDLSTCDSTQAKLTSGAATTGEPNSVTQALSSRGKVVQLRPAAEKLNCNKSLTSGYEPTQQEAGSCCYLPSSKTPVSISSSDEDTRTAIAQALSQAQLSVSTARSEEVCLEIEKQKKKLLVQPGCSSAQEIQSSSSDCKHTPH